MAQSNRGGNILRCESVGKNRKKIYLAAPLFSEAELRFNIRVKEILDSYFDVYLPQEDGGLMVDMVKHGMSPASAARRVFESDIKAIQQCDILLIVLDGRSIDEGAAFELGYASAIGKICIGLQTDIRTLLPYGNNPMLSGALSFILKSIDELSIWVSNHDRVGLKEIDNCAELLENP
jgi:nucleoside 2-deoxyribosyltransferase